MTRLGMPGLTGADHGRTLRSCLPRFTFPAHFLFLWQRLPQLAQSLAHLHKIYNWCLCDNLLSVGRAPQHVGRWSSSLTGLEWIFLGFSFLVLLLFACLPLSRRLQFECHLTCVGVHRQLRVQPIHSLCVLYKPH
ncbi:hypothetical protein NP493_6532g00004 [Ridgeia piscesae]|uniref:Uncharacterized protein n=1 Tax=Ridgeia piscesae TaxID=27915 RepID=A0AAD9IRG7_RIDPI|nr:hypothetical protein NP493_6532g00004 [Ridgeia piscesae]